MGEKRQWELEVCSACGTVCGGGDVRAAHESEVSSCAERGGKVERVVVAPVEDAREVATELRRMANSIEGLDPVIVDCEKIARELRALADKLDGVPGSSGRPPEESG